MKKPGIKSYSTLALSCTQLMLESPSTYLLQPSYRANKELGRELKTETVARRVAAASAFSIALAQSKSPGRITLTSKFLRSRGILMNSREGLVKVAPTSPCY